MIGKNMANAIDSTASACAFTMYERGPDRDEQLRGVRMDPRHDGMVEGALGRLLAHRADCGFMLSPNDPSRWWLFMVGARARREARVGLPHRSFLPAWMA